MRNLPWRFFFVAREGRVPLKTIDLMCRLNQSEDGAGLHLTFYVGFGLRIIVVLF